MKVRVAAAQYAIGEPRDFDTFASRVAEQVAVAAKQGAHVVVLPEYLALEAAAMFDAAPLETASLVEDLKLGLDLAIAGQPVGFEDRAVFLSPASTQAATRGQRTRWEHGALATFGRYAPRLIARGLSGRRHPARVPYQSGPGEFCAP